MDTAHREKELNRSTECLHTPYQLAMRKSSTKPSTLSADSPDLIDMYMHTQPRSHFSPQPGRLEKMKRS